MTLKVATKKRILAIMETITVSGVRITVAPAVPASVQDFEGYVLYTYLSSNTRTRVTRESSEGVMTWLLTIIGKEAGLGLRNDNEDTLYNVADALEERFLRAPQLAIAPLGALSGIMNIALGTGGLVAPSPYPVGQDANTYYVYSTPLEVNFAWINTC